MTLRHAGFVLLTSIGACARPAVVASQASPLDLLASVAHGERTLLSLADPSRGVAFVRRGEDVSGEDPRSDAEGEIVVSRRICDPADPELGYVTNDVAMHFQDEFDYAAFRCQGLVCAAGGLMEYASSLRFEFSRDGGRIRLDRIFAVEDVALDPDYAAARWERAERAMTAIPESCSP